MIRLLFVRHGQTEFNVKKRVQGWCDSPLTQEGIKQARSLKNVLKEVDLLAAYSSTSERCRDTLDVILKDRDIKKYDRKGLKEIYFGLAEGERVEKVFPNGTANLSGYQDIQGESKQQALKRFEDEIQSIVSMYAEGNILIVTHGSILKEFFSHIDMDFKQAAIEAKGSVNKLISNCSLSIVEYNQGNYHLVSYGKTYY